MVGDDICTLDATCQLPAQARSALRSVAPWKRAWPEGSARVTALRSRSIKLNHPHDRQRAKQLRLHEKAFARRSGQAGLRYFRHRIDELLLLKIPPADLAPFTLSTLFTLDHSDNNTHLKHLTLAPFPHTSCAIHFRDIIVAASQASSNHRARVRSPIRQLLPSDAVAWFRHWQAAVFPLQRCQKAPSRGFALEQRNLAEGRIRPVRSEKQQHDRTPLQDSRPDQASPLGQCEPCPGCPQAHQDRLGRRVATSDFIQPSPAFLRRLIFRPTDTRRHRPIRRP